MKDGIKLYLLDMDGTVYVGDRLIDGAKEKIDEIRRKGKRLCFLTNNSSRAPDEYIAKLLNLGIDITRDEIYTSGDSAMRYLKRYRAGKKVYLLGTEKLRKQFFEQGIPLVENDPDIVVVGYDTELTYEKLFKAITFISQGAEYVVTHSDVNCPASPVYAPDVGSFIALIEKSCGRMPDIDCGKPYKYMAEAVAEKFGLRPNQIAMAGDRLATDIRFGADNGFYTVLVLSGEATKADYEKSGLNADLVLNSVADLIV